LSDNYETMKKYLAYLKGREANGLVTYGLGDWMALAGNDVRNVEGAIYVYDTGLARDIATALGKTEDASTYDKEYTRVRDAYNRAYFDPQTKSYQPLKQANEALPLVFGIVPDGEVEAVRQALVNVIAHPPESSRPGQFGPVVANHVTTGDIATGALWQALRDTGQDTLVQTMIMQETTPSYMSGVRSDPDQAHCAAGFEQRVDHLRFGPRPDRNLVAGGWQGFRDQSPYTRECFGNCHRARGGCGSRRRPAGERCDRRQISAIRIVGRGIFGGVRHLQLYVNREEVTFRIRNV
jgi:hypothetical protein